MAPCAVTMRPPSVESVAMVRVRARETIVEGGRGYETPPPTPPRKRRPSPPATSPSQPRISPRCCKVPTPEPAAEKFVERGRVLQLGDGTKIRMDSPRLKQAMGHTGVMTDDIKPLKTTDFVLAARREGKGEEQAKRIGVRRYNMHELLRQQHLAELLACRAQFPEPVRAPFPRQASPAAFLCPADISTAVLRLRLGVLWQERPPEPPPRPAEGEAELNESVQPQVRRLFRLLLQAFLRAA
eukprot:COSAG04_NODE_361_length_15860_cov_18.114904_13_plen_241_part_00